MIEWSFNLILMLSTVIVLLFFSGWLIYDEIIYEWIQEKKHRRLIELNTIESSPNNIYTTYYGRFGKEIKDRIQIQRKNIRRSA